MGHEGLLPPALFIIHPLNDLILFTIFTGDHRCTRNDSYKDPGAWLDDGNANPHASPFRYHHRGARQTPLRTEYSRITHTLGKGRPHEQRKPWKELCTRVNTIMLFSGVLANYSASGRSMRPVGLYRSSALSTRWRINDGNLKNADSCPDASNSSRE